jgi:hypothetical protein
MQVSGQLQVPAALPFGNESPNPLRDWLVGLQNCSGRFAEKTDPLSLKGIEARSLKRPSRSLDTKPTELSRLRAKKGTENEFKNQNNEVNGCAPHDMCGVERFACREWEGSMCQGAVTLCCLCWRIVTWQTRGWGRFSTTNEGLIPQ